MEGPGSRFEPRRGKDGATAEEGSEVDGAENDCEDSYRMWEMNKQMSPLQPLPDLTTPALQHGRMYDSVRASRKVKC